MSDITNLLLKHGVKSLIEEDQDFFKQNITQALAIKLNETVQEVKEEVSKNLLRRNETTEETQELKEFVKFIDTFKGGNFVFKNGSSLNITDSEIGAIKKLFESLSSNNRQKMVSEIFEDGSKFKNHINFYQKASKLL